mmetsp:Transcript_4143/g.7570  ORF Transcript_4143/g.7570 Transcript_4143/m.7570 type:complete len:97 (-) Transcript_4143:47-337(-)
MHRPALIVFVILPPQPLQPPQPSPPSPPSPPPTILIPIPIPIPKPRPRTTLPKIVSSNGVVDSSACHFIYQLITTPKRNMHRIASIRQSGEGMFGR